MTATRSPAPFAGLVFAGGLPRRDDVARIFDELDFQLACQVYLWALPLVPYAQGANRIMRYSVPATTTSFTT
jgi:hypothetical protein